MNVPISEHELVTLLNEILTSESLMWHEELAVKLEAVIKELSPQSQKIFLMNRYEGKKYKEISEELQISLKTAEAHISKALLILRKALQKDWLSGFVLMWLYR